MKAIIIPTVGIKTSFPSQHYAYGSLVIHSKVVATVVEISRRHYHHTSTYAGTALAASSRFLRSFSRSTAHMAAPAAVVIKNNMDNTGTSCNPSATVPNHVYLHLLCLTKTSLSSSFNFNILKYRWWWNGPARRPLMTRKRGVPNTGMKVRGRRTMYSRVRRKEKGEYSADLVVFPSCFNGSVPSSIISRLVRTRSVNPSFTKI